MEMNVEKTMVLRISRQPSQMKIIIDQKTTRVWSVATILVA
jgi:hypothetical protein